MERIGKKRLWSRYLVLWHRLSGWRLFLFYTLHYTVLFIILCPILFTEFRNAGKSYIWTQDEMPMDFTQIVYYSKTIRDGIQSLFAGAGWKIPLYNFSSGVASTNMQVFPIRLLGAFWKWDRIDTLFSLLVLLRYYLCGLSFSLLGFYFKRGPLPVLTGAVSYEFSGFAIYAGMHAADWYLTPMIIMPLLVVGAEKILRKEKPFLFIAMVFALITSNLLFACIMAILITLYSFVRFLSIYEKNRTAEFLRFFGRYALAGITGIALGSIIVIPTLLQIFNSGRVGRDIWEYTDAWHYGNAYYLKFAARFIAASEGAGYWVRLGFSVLTFPALLLLFIRKQEDKTIRRVFIIFTLMLMFPFVGYVMSGFNTNNNRWCMAYTLCCSAILTFELPHFLEMDRHQLSLVGIGTVTYLLCCFVLDHNYFKEEVYVLLVAAIMLLALFVTADTRVKAATMLMCLAVTCLSVRYTSYSLFAPGEGNYISQFSDLEEPYKYWEQSQYASFSKSDLAEDSTGFYRVSGSNISRESVNSAFYYDVNGLSAYSETSSIYPAYIHWMEEFEQARTGFNNIEFGPIGRSHMLTLGAVKYYVVQDAGEDVFPYGFEAREKIQNGNRTDVILENEYALPIGYTYDRYLLRNEYEALDALGKQEAQLQAVVIDKEPGSEKIDTAAIEVTAKQIPVEVIDTKDVTWKDGKVTVKAAGGTLTLAFEGIPETETYLRVVDLDLTNGADTSQWVLTAATEDTIAKARFCADAYLYSNNMKTQMLDLGCSEDGYAACTITFPKKGTFMLDDLQIWCQPMDRYGEQVNALRKESLENVKTNWRGLTGEISVSKDKMMCLAVPYDEGWTAYVDGVKTDIYQANTAFMAIELEAGEHTVEFKYMPTGMTCGLVLTVAGFGVVIGMLVHDRRRRSKDLA